MMRTLILTIIIAAGQSAIFGQENSWMTLEPAEEERQPDTPTIVLPKDSCEVDFNKPKGNIKVKTDKGVEEISRVLGKPLPGKNVTMPGYRVQIFFGTMQEAEQMSKKFKQMYFNTGSYTQYKEPNFHVLVGDFYTKLQAEEFRNEISDFFPMSIIVTDDIELPALD